MGEEAQRTIRVWRRWRTVAAAVVLAVSATVLIISPAARGRLGAALMFAGALYMLWQFRVRKVPESLREALENQRDLARRAWFCYAGAVVPAAALILSGGGIYMFNLMMYVLLGAELGYRAVERLEESLARDFVV